MDQDELNTPIQHPAYCVAHLEEALKIASEKAGKHGVRVLPTHNNCVICGEKGIYYLTYMAWNRDGQQGYLVGKGTRTL